MTRVRPWRVLVTDSGYKHTLAVVRDLGSHHDVDVCGPRRLAMAGVSRWCHRNLRSPATTEPEAFLAWLDQAVARFGYDQILPVGYAACRLLAEHIDRWADTRVVLAPATTMSRALDKRAMNALARSLGVPAPRTCQPDSLEALEGCAAETGYPLIIKGPIEGQGDVAYVDQSGELRPAFEAYLRRNAWAEASLPILQQRIEGPGFGLFATFQEGSPRRTMVHRRIREYPPTGGASSCAEVVDVPEVRESGLRLLDALAWHGVAMVEFKRHDADGRYYLMEVNPKLWGSLDLAIAAGCDFPGDLVAIAQGHDLSGPSRPPSPVRLCWPLDGDLRHLAARPTAWREVLGDWIRPSVRTNIRPSDPLPHLVEAAETARALVASRG